MSKNSSARLDIKKYSFKNFKHSFKEFKLYSKKAKKGSIFKKALKLFKALAYIGMVYHVPFSKAQQPDATFLFRFGDKGTVQGEFRRPYGLDFQMKMSCILLIL